MEADGKIFEAAPQVEAVDGRDSRCDGDKIRLRSALPDSGAAVLGC